MIKRMRGLPSYFGGKRTIAPFIFKYLPKPTKARPLTFLDPMMGGGSVSYFAKMLGYQVIAGDVSYRSWLTGKTCIELKSCLLPPYYVFLKENEHEWLWTHYKDYFPNEEITRFLDRVRQNVRARGDREVELFFYMKLVSRMVPFMLFGKFLEPFKKRVIQDKNQDLARIAAHKLWKPQAINLLNPERFIKNTLESTAQTIFDNGQENTFVRQDVFKTLAQFAGNANAVYFDPPYPGTQGYDSMFWVDRLILEDDKFEDVYGAEFTDKNQFKQNFERLVKESACVPNFVCSIGNWNHEELLGIVRETRPNAQMLVVKHDWLQAIKNGAKGDELLIIDSEEMQ